MPGLGLTNLYLEDIAWDKLRLKKFLGVFSSDTLPFHLILPSKFSLISNFSSSKEKGTHFISVTYDAKAGEINYFDSYGAPCYLPELLRFLEQLKNSSEDCKVNYNSKQIQTFNSIYCGYFSLAHCLAFEKRNCSFDQFLNIFTSNASNKNETKCIDFLVD